MTMKNIRLLEKIRKFFIPDPMPIPKHIAINLKDHTGIEKETIITFSTQNWADLWTRKQRFSLQFARQGNRVVYIETQFHWVSYFLQFKTQWRRIFLFLTGFRKVEENLYIYTPPILFPAFQIFPSIAKFNNVILAFFVKREMIKHQMTEPVLWMYTHFNKPLVKKLKSKKVLYECVDDYSEAKGLIKKETVIKQEKETLKQSSAVIVTADSLKPKMLEENNNVHIISNAANIAHFKKAYNSVLSEPDEYKSIQRPRLLFIGALQYWVDQELIACLAESHPEWQILFVGPVSVSTKRLNNFKNIHLLGRKDYDDLPNYLAHSDIALNPYKVDGVAEGCSPLKLYEYLAAGLPVVSTEMPEVRKFEGIVKVAENYNEFIDAVDEFLSMDKQSLDNIKAKSVEISTLHSWENRFKKVETVLQEVLS
ncbi:MAG: glycosyltransferase family 1 protein [Calditrichaeota bacterium]|nr:MAG: glycosyltransferase family 1 protein [Calditrichota bacterium]